MRFIIIIGKPERRLILREFSFAKSRKDVETNKVRKYKLKQNFPRLETFVITQPVDQ